MASTSTVDNSKRKEKSPEESSCRKRHRLSFEEQDNESSACVICLEIITNKSFANNCLHTFCFECLLKWSEQKADCPLCKGPFTAIIHNVKSDQEYDEHMITFEDEDSYLNAILVFNSVHRIESIPDDEDGYLNSNYNLFLDSEQIIESEEEDSYLNSIINFDYITSDSSTSDSSTSDSSTSDSNA